MLAKLVQSSSVALIDPVPQDTTLRQQRATLLDQEGLTEAAAYDRQLQ